MSMNLIEGQVPKTTLLERVKRMIWFFKMRYFRGKSNYQKHFEKELEILRSTLEKDDSLIIDPYIPAIKKLIKAFDKEGHSGCSAGYTAPAIANTIKNILLFEPLAPITGKDEEWNYNDPQNDSYQNKRLSSVFKQGKDGQPYYLYAIVWKTQTGSTWTGSALKTDGTRVRSRQYIKLPFKPKTFYIDVIEKEIAKDDWENYIVDEKQLEEVFQYYDKYKED